MAVPGCDAVQVREEESGAQDDPRRVVVAVLRRESSRQALFGLARRTCDAARSIGRGAEQRTHIWVAKFKSVQRWHATLGLCIATAISTLRVHGVDVRRRG